MILPVVNAPGTPTVLPPNTHWKITLAAVIGLSMLCSPAHAATVVHADVRHENGRYFVAFEMLLRAKAAHIRHLITDYNHLHRLSDLVLRSELLTPFPDGRPRVRMQLQGCMLFFCRSLHKLESVSEEADGRLVITADPAESDYRYSRVEWQLQEDAGQTRVRYRAEQEPDFFIPPLIGPWLIKLRIHDELELLGPRLEQLAQTASTGL